MDSKWQVLIGFAPLLSTGIIAIKGIDALTFLQGQLTVNLNNVTLRQSQLGAHCNLKGRMQSLFRIINIQKSDQEPAYLLLLPKALLATALVNLKKYAIFSKVTLTEASDATVFGIVGEQAPTFLATYLGEDAIKDLPIGGCTSVNHLVVCHVPGNVARYEIIVPNAFVDDFQQAMLAKTTALSLDDWEQLDIQAGIPTVYPATVDALLPHHVNLTQLHGISFDKGCYLGQEIIARMHYKGKIKRHMYRAQLIDTVEAPCPGDQVVIVDAPNEALGIVVRTAKTDQGFELLVVLDEQYADFKNIRFKKADGPKLHRLDLAY